MRRCPSFDRCILRPMQEVNISVENLQHSRFCSSMNALLGFVLHLQTIGHFTLRPKHMQVPSTITTSMHQQLSSLQGRRKKLNRVTRQFGRIVFRTPEEYNPAMIVRHRLESNSSSTVQVASKYYGCCCCCRCLLTVWKKTEWLHQNCSCAQGFTMPLVLH